MRSTGRARWARLPALLPLLASIVAMPAFADCVRTVRWELEPPYGVLGPDGQRAGYYAEVVEQALKRIGCEPAWVPMPWARGLRELEAGRLDIMPGMIATAERRRYARFSAVVNRSPNLLFLRAGAAQRHRLTRLADLRDTGLTIAVETGAHYGDEYAALLRDTRFAARLHPVPDPDRAWRMLDTGRIDGLIADQAAALAGGVPLVPGPRDVHAVLALSAGGARVAFSRRSVDEAFVARFDAAIAAMLAEGSLLRLRERYVPCPADPVTLGCRDPAGVGDNPPQGHADPSGDAEGLPR